jgi:hypothetical protein
MPDDGPKPGERDEPIKIDLPFRDAIDGLLRVDPDAPPAHERDDAAEPASEKHRGGE